MNQKFQINEKNRDFNGNKSNSSFAIVKGGESYVVGIAG
jgi:hypothetical protein